VTLRLAAAFVALVGLAAGSGGADPVAAPSATSPTSTHTETHAHQAPALGSCQRIGETEEGPLRLCPAAGRHGAFVVGEGDAAEDLHILPGRVGPAGHWSWAAISPDGSTLLAQWTAECEVPIAFFIFLPAGTPLPVTGETAWARRPSSEALGWTTEGRALVFLPHGPGCGSGPDRAGVYAYGAPGAGKRIVATHGESVSPVRRSRTPRDAASLEP